MTVGTLDQVPTPKKVPEPALVETRLLLNEARQPSAALMTVATPTLTYSCSNTSWMKSKSLMLHCELQLLPFKGIMYVWMYGCNTSITNTLVNFRRSYNNMPTHANPRG